MSEYGYSRPIQTGGWKSTLALILAAIALLVSCATFAYTVFQNPLGKGISAYSFDTPEDALMSEIQMEANFDILADLERRKRMNEKEVKELLDSIEVDKTRNYKKKKLLFISYERKGKDQYEVKSFKKDKETGWWVRDYVSAFEVENDDEELAEEMREWEAKSEKIEEDDDKD